MKRICFIFFILFTSILIGQEKNKKDRIPVWKIHGRFAFVFNQSSFSNWSSGGENTIAGNFNVNYDFNYKKDNVNWDSRLITGYGLSHLSENGLRKTDDRFEFNTLLGVKTTKYWFFSFIANFKTQYTKGFDYKKEPKVLVSEFYHLHI